MEKSVTERLERLEKQNRRFKQLGFALILVVGAFGLMGQQPALNRELKAQKFTLHDAEGRTRGCFLRERASQF